MSSGSNETPDDIQLLPGDHHSGTLKDCPACGGCDCGTVISDSVPAFEFTVQNMTVVHPAYKIIQCSNCGLYYKSDRLSDETIDRYYDLLDFNSFESEVLFPTDRVIMQYIKTLGKGSSILDFGCSTGRILLSLADTHECYGVEINRDAANVAARKGIRIITEKDLAEATSPNFNAVILSDVYEHLSNPVRLLELLLSNLRCGGVLILSTGCADYVRYRALLSHHWYFRCPGHFHMVGLQHIDWLAHTLKLTVSGYRRVCHYDSSTVSRLRQYMQFRFYWLFKNHPDRIVSRFLSKLPLLGKADTWPQSPATSYAKDHIVAVFKKSEG